MIRKWLQHRENLLKNLTMATNHTSRRKMGRELSTCTRTLHKHGSRKVRIRHCHSLKKMYFTVFFSVFIATQEYLLIRWTFSVYARRYILLRIIIRSRCYKYTSRISSHLPANLTILLQYPTTHCTVWKWRCWQCYSVFPNSSTKRTILLRKPLQSQW